MKYTDYVKSQVSSENWELLKSMNLNFDERATAQIWRAYVNAPKRWETEIPFLIGQLREYYGQSVKRVEGKVFPRIVPHIPRVFDAAAGSGATSIGLARAGFDVVPNEADFYWRQIAHSEMDFLLDHPGIDIRMQDWRELKLGPDEEPCDALVCLGNSYTYLHRREDQLRALWNFYTMVHQGGKIILDTRNYEPILRGEFFQDHTLLYCGEDVHVKPKYTSKSMVVWEYASAHLEKPVHNVIYPYTEDELDGLFDHVGLTKREKYYDYQREKPEKYSIITYVARK